MSVSFRSPFSTSNSIFSGSNQLTSKILKPDGPFQQEDVIRNHYDVHSLEYQEEMPRLSGVSRMPERSQAQGHRRKGDDESGRAGDPSKDIDGTTPIALIVPKVSFYIKHVRMIFGIPGLTYQSSACRLRCQYTRPVVLPASGRMDRCYLSHAQGTC
jgi:hypothetical protein